MGRHKTCPYIGRIFCRGNPRGCPIVGRFSKIDRAVSRDKYTPTQAQQTDDYPGDLEHRERRSPFPTNDLFLCRGRGFRSEQRSLFTTTTAKCQHALGIKAGPTYFSGEQRLLFLADSVMETLPNSSGAGNGLQRRFIAAICRRGLLAPIRSDTPISVHY